MLFFNNIANLLSILSLNIASKTKSELEKELEILKKKQSTSNSSSGIASTGASQIPSPNPNSNKGLWNRLKELISKIFKSLHWSNLKSWKGIITWFIGIITLAKIFKTLFRLFAFLFSINFAVLLTSFDWSFDSIKVLMIKFGDVMNSFKDYLFASYKNLYKNIVYYLFSGSITEDETSKSLKDHYDKTKINEIKEARDKLMKKIIKLKSNNDEDALESTSLRDKSIYYTKQVINYAQSNWKWISAIFGFGAICAIVIYKLVHIYLAIVAFLDPQSLQTVTQLMGNLMYLVYSAAAVVFTKIYSKFRGSRSDGNPGGNDSSGGDIDLDPGPLNDDDNPWEVDNENDNDDDREDENKRYFASPPLDPWNPDKNDEDVSDTESDDTVKPDKGKSNVLFSKIMDFIDHSKGVMVDCNNNYEEFQHYYTRLKKGVSVDTQKYLQRLGMEYKHHIDHHEYNLDSLEKLFNRYKSIGTYKNLKEMNDLRVRITREEEELQETYSQIKKELSKYVTF